MKQEKLYMVKALGPKTGPGSSMDSRSAGPFSDRRIAEAAIIELLRDPRQYATIRLSVHQETEEK